MRIHQQAPNAAHTTPDSRALAHLLARYRTPNAARSVLELLITAVPFALIWIVIWAALDAGYWAGLLLAVPAAGFPVRLFMIQHDCGHGAFFHSRRANDWVGRVVGVLTLTPYGPWRRAHARHHAGSGNLDRRGIGRWMEFYNQRQPHSALGGRTPHAVYWSEKDQEQPGWQARSVA